MNNKNLIPSFVIALGITLLGVFIKSGIDNYTNKDRKVTVKGLAEKEVNADKVTWPLATKINGNSLPELYKQIEETQNKVKGFLTRNGVKDNEIRVSAPQIYDLESNVYNENRKAYRYSVTSVVTVTSKNVNLIKELINRQAELYKEGIAITNSEYQYQTKWEYTAFRDMKPKMMQEAIGNAEKTAQQFAENSHSDINKIITADQGQFSIDDLDENTPWIKKIRVVTTVTYSLKN
ncbi:SIMPL domain-containing protein [Xylanibacter muris]|uniref:SIMPL domain-containing protein n=1 Tax=Xylanibacter muris TaxID=2736290 RepID=A0ABX2APH8_9BACT|nr:SIMPL domain-containing protein [Xylanibacter muris]NPD93108.1 SIMPL domain-containing protein [Xylanibacter muris]